MRVRSSLYTKLVLWLLLNLLLIGGLFFALPGRAGLGWSVLLSQPVRERLVTIGERIAKDLSAAPETGWDQVLSSYSAEYGVAFSVERGGAMGVFTSRIGGPPPGGEAGSVMALDGLPPPPPPDDGPRLGPGPPLVASSGVAAGSASGPQWGTQAGPPPGGRSQDLRGSISDQPGGPFGAQPGGPGPGPPPRDMVFHYNADGGSLSFSASGPPVPPPFADRKLRGNMVAINHLSAFDTYQLRIPALLERGSEPARPIILQAYAAGVGTLLRFLGVTEWLQFALLVIGLSALLWWPFIWGITRTVVRVTRATGDIADGRFETRVHTRRRDELGQLAEAVNRMAQRLHSHLAGQKQFLADIAHEITSPLARLQLGLGILETRTGEDAQPTLQDVQEEAQQMGRLLNELLLFSRTGLEAERGPPSAVELRPVLEQVLKREDPGQRVRLEVEDGLSAMAHAALLERAAANLVRNALRYAGGAAVEVAAARSAGAVLLWVRDRGPGVPEVALPRLGEPFFRPELARDRDSGGTGLGLAIVRRCVEACGGMVVFRNREGGGFEAEVRLGGVV